MAMQQKTLSNRTVAALTVERDTVFWDRNLTGFGIRVYPSGGKVYIAQARGPEGPKRVTVGRHDVLNADRTRQRAALIIARIKAGEEPVPLPLAARINGGPDGGRPRRALSRRACRGAAQAEDEAAGSRHARQSHPAGPRQNATGGGGAQPRRRAAPDTVRPSGLGEQGGQDPVAHVPAGRGLGPGAGGLQSLPLGREIPRAVPRALPDPMPSSPGWGGCWTRRSRAAPLLRRWPRRRSAC